MASLVAPGRMRTPMPVVEPSLQSASGNGIHVHVLAVASVSGAPVKPAPGVQLVGAGDGALPPVPTGDDEPPPDDDDEPLAPPDDDVVDDAWLALHAGGAG